MPLEARIDFFGVVSDPFALPSEARGLRKRFELPFPLLFDANGVLASRLQPRATPEAYLYDARGVLAYRGRIDDRVSERFRSNAPRRRDLLEAIEALVEGDVIAVPRTGAVGCAFEGWGEPQVDGVTWARNVAPILDTHCIDCHGETGPAPFGLCTYEEAARRSKMIARVAVERTMPPWHAARGIGCLAGERGLDDREVRTLELWSLGGARRGEDADRLLPCSKSMAPRTQPDLVLTLPDVTVPADGGDLFRVLALSTPASEERWVKAAGFRFSNVRLVRQALLLPDEQRCAATLDELDPEPGYDAASGTGCTLGPPLARWLPGSAVDEYPLGVARRLAEQTSLAMWIHLHPSGVKETVSIAVDLWFAHEPIAEAVRYEAIDSRGAPILNDEHGGSRIHCEQHVEVPGRILAVIPCMERSGMEIRVTLRSPDGTEWPLVSVPRWDELWPERYRFRDPIHLSRDALVMLDARLGDRRQTSSSVSAPPEPLTPEAAGPARCYLEMAVPLPTGDGPSCESRSDDQHR